MFFYKSLCEKFMQFYVLWSFKYLFIMCDKNIRNTNFWARLLARIFRIKSLACNCSIMIIIGNAIFV